MSKERPISMSCTQEQFERIKGRIPYKIKEVDNFRVYPVLTNFYYDKKRVSNTSCKDVEHHDTFNADIFLEACGVEITKKYAVKLTPNIKAWIKEELESDWYKYEDEYYFFHFPNSENYDGFIAMNHCYYHVRHGYTEVTEQEFLAEFGRVKTIIQILTLDGWRDIPEQEKFRIKPSDPDYSKEIEALQAKAKENGMIAIINFEKL